MYVSRGNQAKIYAAFANPFITALLGPRRVGKSTLVNHYASEHPEHTWALLNMDRRDERLQIERSGLLSLVQEKIQRLLTNGAKIWVVVDEAQKCPAIFDQIKELYDQYKDKNRIKFILTGSSFLALHQLSAESLAGRIEIYYLREFNLFEATALQHTIALPSSSIFEFITGPQPDIQLLENHVNLCSPLRRSLENSLTQQLLWGGLPEVLTTSTDDNKRIYLSNYLQTYLEKDVRDIQTITDINLYHQLMETIAEQTGSLRQDTELLKVLGCSRDTLKKYRGILMATLMYTEIYPFIGSSLKRLVKSPKAYLLDNGLISYLTGIDELAVLQKSGLIGHRFESWFLKELQIWLDRETRRSEIYYWRTSNGNEVDFIVQKNPFVYAFEVTYSNRVQDKKIKNLINFMANEPKAKLGFYIYTGEYFYDSKNNICFLPAWAIG